MGVRKQRTTDGACPLILLRRQEEGGGKTNKVMAKLKITQTRSVINTSMRQRRTLEALGLRRIRHSVTHDDTPVIQGMIDKVRHLVEVEDVE